MTTANDIIKSGLRVLGIPGEGSALTAEQSKDALEVLNQMFSSYGIERVAAGADDIPIPPEHEGNLRYALAQRLAGEYERDLRPADAIEAQIAAAALETAFSDPPLLKFDRGLRSRTYGGSGTIDNT